MHFYSTKHPSCLNPPTSLSLTVYNRKVVEQKLGYIHNNPFSGKWTLTDIPENYRNSSAKYYLLSIDEWRFMTHYAEHI